MFREPSISKSISASTTGKLKRDMMRAIDPYYGKKGVGWIRNPEKALYNYIYNRTTVDTRKIYAEIYTEIEKNKKEIVKPIQQKKRSVLFRILKFILWGD